MGQGTQNARYRLGVVNFLNAYPLWATLQSEPSVQLFPGIPSHLAKELRTGQLDAALISSVEYLRHPEGFSYHPGLCIAAATESKSIRLFAQSAAVPFREKMAQTPRIYTDIASRSSVAQLAVILQELQQAPQLIEVADPQVRISELAAGEALLSIGDTALRFMQHPSYDLQTAYYEIFRRGFVYALWVGRSEIMAELAPVLAAAYQQWFANRAELLGDAVTRFGFDAAFTKHYLTQIIEHRLGAERESDLDFFARRIAGI